MGKERQANLWRTTQPGPGHARQALLMALEGVYASPEVLEGLFGGQTLGQGLAQPIRHAGIPSPRACDVAYAAV